MDFSKVSEISVPVDGEQKSVVEIDNSNGNVLWAGKITVQQLIDKGYATVSGSFVTLRPTMSYREEQIVDFDEHINAVTPRFKWNNLNLPCRLDNDSIIDKYNGATMSIVPTGGMFHGLDFSNYDDFTITFNGGSWCVVDNGIFCSRYHGGTYKPGPLNLTVNINGAFTSIFTTGFVHIPRVKHITLTATNHFSCHGVSGMFELCGDLETITFKNVRMQNGGECFNNISYICDWCGKLKEFPLGYPELARDHVYNTIKPKCRTQDNPSDAGAMQQAFYYCGSLVRIAPTFDFSLVTSYVSTMFTACNSLEDLHIKNLGCTWDFTNCPSLSVESIEYILSNLVDKSSGNACTVTFGTLHDSEINSDIYASAVAKNWNIVFHK